MARVTRSNSSPAARPAAHTAAADWARYKAKHVSSDGTKTAWINVTCEPAGTAPGGTARALVTTSARLAPAAR